MFKPLRLLVLTPEATLLDASAVQQIQLRLADGGGLGIFPGHAPLVAETVSAPVCYVDGDGQHCLDMEAGIVQISAAVVTLFTGGLQSSAAETGRAAPEDGVRLGRLAYDLRRAALQRGKKAKALARELSQGDG